MPATSPTSEVEYNPDDEITIERKVKVVETEQQFVRTTTKMGAVDARLIAIARGEIDPEVDCDLFVMDDPFGGLILVEDEEPADETSEIDDEWLLEDVDAELDDPASDFVVPPRVIPMTATPRLCMRASELVALPLDHRSGFLLSHIDGKRTVENVVDVSHLSPEDTLEALGSLIALGAITID
jgi:hypothetical protein